MVYSNNKLPGPVSQSNLGTGKLGNPFNRHTFCPKPPLQSNQSSPTEQIRKKSLSIMLYIIIDRSKTDRKMRSRLFMNMLHLVYAIYA